MASQAQAQLGFLDRVFANVTHANAAYLIGRPLRGNELVGDQGGKLSMHGVGFEVVVALGPLVASKPDRTCLKPKVEYTPVQRERSSTDTIYIDKPVEVDQYPDSLAVPDEKETRKRKRAYDKRCDREPSLHAEVALGYALIGGFTGRDVKLRGSLENLPAIGFYATWVTGTWVKPYLGIRTGMAQLKGFQAFLSDTGRLTAAGSTWQLGVAPGISVGAPESDGALFVELEWMYRKFEDIQWTPVLGAVPLDLRRPTHLSTFIISVGAQIGIGKDK